jgi:hypothetical protein
MHILFSYPREADLTKPYGKVKAFETISQYIFLGIVIFLCFYQPPFLVDFINQSISILPKSGY